MKTPSARSGPRSKIVQRVLYLLLSSPIIQTSLFLLAGLAGYLFNEATYLLILPVFVIILRFKPLVFEVSDRHSYSLTRVCRLLSLSHPFQVLLMQHRIEQSLGIFHWYDKIEENLILGAVPLENLNHVKVCVCLYFI